MGDETDAVDRLEQSLEELEEQGELDSERITFRTMSIGGVHLDRLDSALSKVDYDRDPVRITIEPETEHPEDHHYRIEFEDLDRDERGNYVLSDIQERMDGLEEQLRALDVLVPTEIDDIPDIGRYGNGTMSFEVEAEIVEVDGPGRAHTEYQVPNDVVDLVTDYGGEMRDVALYPEGRGWGEPTFAVEVVIE